MSASIVGPMKLQNATYANQSLLRFITTVKAADGRQLRKRMFVIQRLSSKNLCNQNMSLSLLRYNLKVRFTDVLPADIQTASMFPFISRKIRTKPGSF